jgi:hypothetical protein
MPWTRATRASSVRTMSLRLTKALGGLTAVAVFATLPAHPAQAREADPRPSVRLVHAKADGPDHYSSSATVELPAGGAANVVSPTLPKDMTKTQVTISAPLSDDGGFADAVMSVLQQPTPGKRLMACIGFATRELVGIAAYVEAIGEMDIFEAVAQQLFAARMEYCMRVAQFVAQYDSPRLAGRAGTACGQTPLGIPEKVTKSDGSYTVTKNGNITDRKRNAKVKVTCKVVGPTKIVMTVKAKKKGTPLRKALRSKSLGVAIGSSPDASEGATMTVAFAAK